LAFASCSHVRALAAGLPRADHVLITTNQLVRFRQNDFDELDSTDSESAFIQTILNPALTA